MCECIKKILLCPAKTLCCCCKCTCQTLFGGIFFLFIILLIIGLIVYFCVFFGNSTPDPAQQNVSRMLNDVPATFRELFKPL